MAVRLSDSEALVSRAVDDLGSNWERTAWGWHDKARADFERDYLDELRTVAKGARGAMKSIDEVLRQAIRECS